MFAGKEEAKSAGKALKQEKYKFDVAHTSVLTRAQKTLEAILKEIGQTDLPVEKSWRLNERHYGGLTGLNKAETAAKYGEDQVSSSDCVISTIEFICSAFVTCSLLMLCSYFALSFMVTTVPNQQMYSCQ